MTNRPVVLVVMDGIGLTENKLGNAVMNAYTPNLDELMNTCPNTAIAAHGLAVGLPSNGDMGNSEVGHNALGCGQIYSQGAKRVDESIENKDIFESKTYNEMIDYCKTNNGTFHFLGLLSDGNVHSNIKHLFTLLEGVKSSGITKARVHILLDGRDVPPQSADTYIEMLENKLSELNDDTFDAKIASGGGRMYITMDRYKADWEMVERGYNVHVLGEGKQFNSALEALKYYREQDPEIVDQDIHEFVIADESVMSMHDAVTGGLKKDVHFVHVEPNRDFKPFMIGDVRTVIPGDKCPDCGADLYSKKGNETTYGYPR